MPKIKNQNKQPIFERMAKEAGGVSNLATNIGVSISLVSKWLRNDVQVPIKHALAIEMLTKGGIKARQLRPDIMKHYELVARKC